MNDPRVLFVLFVLTLAIFLYIRQTQKIPNQGAVVENMEEGPGSKIKLAPTPARNLDHIYGAATKELPFCVFGEKTEGGEYQITKLGLPEIQTSKPNRTRFTNESCRSQDRFLGMVHNHEEGKCEPSQRDLFTFLSSKMDIFLVYCGNKDDKDFVGVTRDIFP